MARACSALHTRRAYTSHGRNITGKRIPPSTYYFIVAIFVSQKYTTMIRSSVTLNTNINGTSVELLVLTSTGTPESRRILLQAPHARLIIQRPPPRPRRRATLPLHLPRRSRAAASAAARAPPPPPGAPLYALRPPAASPPLSPQAASVRASARVPRARQALPRMHRRHAPRSPRRRARRRCRAGRGAGCAARCAAGRYRARQRE